MDSKKLFEKLSESLRWNVPYTASQGEEEYAIVSTYDKLETAILEDFAKGGTEFEVPGIKPYFYRLLPSSFSKSEKVLYKIRKR